MTEGNRDEKNRATDPDDYKRLADDETAVDWDDFEAMIDRVLTLPPPEHDED